MAGHEVGIGGWESICSGVSGRSKPPRAPAQPHYTYLDMQPRKSCSGCGGSGCCALPLPRGSFTGGFSPFARGPGRGEAMLSAGTHCGHACPAPHPLAQHMMGCRGAGWSPLPPGTLCLLRGRRGSQELLGVGPESGLTPSAGVWGVGS